VLNSPLRLVDPSGECSAPPDLKEGEVGLCVATFISKAKVGKFDSGDGDNRGPVGNDPEATSRQTIHIKVKPLKETGEFRVEAKSTAGISKYRGGEAPGRADMGLTRTSPRVDRETGNLTLPFRATAINGALDRGIPFSPTGVIKTNINVIVTPDSAVGVGAGGSRTAFPSVEVFRYEAGAESTPTPILILGETHERDLNAPLIPIPEVKPKK
jgi:hypothetical protein